MKNTRPVTLAVFVMIVAHGQASADTQAVGAPVHSFSVSPAAVTVQLRGHLQFSLSSSEAVSWEVNGISGGSRRGGHDHSGRSLHRARVASQTRPARCYRATHERAEEIGICLINLASGAVYYVSTSGSDSNAGSQAAPWRTIQHAATSVKAGDTVNIRAGVYNEAVTPSVSGSAAAGSITFQSYPGETAVIDGTGLKVVNGQSGLFNISNRDYITVSGLEIRNFTSKSDSQVPVGIYVSGADNHIQLLSNHVHNITTTAPANADNCASNALGIAIYGTAGPRVHQQSDHQRQRG